MSLTGQGGEIENPGPRIENTGTGNSDSLGAWVAEQFDTGNRPGSSDRTSLACMTSDLVNTGILPDCRIGSTPSDGIIPNASIRLASLGGGWGIFPRPDGAGIPRLGEPITALPGTPELGRTALTDTTGGRLVAATGPVDTRRVPPAGRHTEVAPTERVDPTGTPIERAAARRTPSLHPDLDKLLKEKINASPAADKKFFEDLRTNLAKLDTGSLSPERLKQLLDAIGKIPGTGRQADAATKIEQLAKQLTEAQSRADTGRPHREGAGRPRPERQGHRKPRKGGRKKGGRKGGRKGGKGGRGGAAKSAKKRKQQHANADQHAEGVAEEEAEMEVAEEAEAVA